MIEIHLKLRIFACNKIENP